MEDSQLVCQGAGKLIFSCSGAADTGAVADAAARQLGHQGVGKMFCLAGIGGRVEAIMKTTAAADKILAIDGCGLDCVKKCLEQAGFSGFEHLQLGTMGLEKGKTPLCVQTVDMVAEKAGDLLA